MNTPELKQFIERQKIVHKTYVEHMLQTRQLQVAQNNHRIEMKKETLQKIMSLLH